MLINFFLLFFILGVSFIIFGYYIRNPMIFYLGIFITILLSLYIAFLGIDYKSGSTVTTVDGVTQITYTYQSFTDRTIAIFLFLGSIAMWYVALGTRGFKSTQESKYEEYYDEQD